MCSPPAVLPVKLSSTDLDVASTLRDHEPLGNHYQPDNIQRGIFEKAYHDQATPQNLDIPEAGEFDDSSIKCIAPANVGVIEFTVHDGCPLNLTVCPQCHLKWRDPKASACYFCVYRNPYERAQKYNRRTVAPK
jgi:hypothetical protein